jgi:hypothetical protein
MPKNLLIKTGATGTSRTSGKLSKIDKSLTSITTSAAKMALGYFGVRGVINAFKFATNAAGEQELAEKKLEAALGKVSNALLTQASALQKVTRFGDEAIIGVQASIAMFTDNEEAIKRATIATLDMASATGMDLKSAGDLIAKTLGSSTNALSRYGIVVEGAVGSTERLDTLTKNIADKMGGQAAAAAQTYLGQMEQLKNVFGDVAERMGSRLLPEIIKFITPLKDTMEMWLKYRDAIDGVGSGVLRLTPELRHMAKTLEDQDIMLQATEKNTAAYFFQLQLVKNLTADYKIKLDEYNKSKETEVSATKALIEPFDAYILKQREDIALKQQEAEWLDVIIEMYPILAEQMGLVDKATEKAGYSWDTFRKNMDMAAASSILARASIISTTDAMGAAGKAAKGAAADFISAEIQKAVASWISSMIETAGPLGWLAAPIALAGGAAFGSIMGSAIERFGTGGDFTTSGPQMIMVGDNPGGRERVQVTPESSPNINGKSRVE